MPSWRPRYGPRSWRTDSIRRSGYLHASKKRRVALVYDLMELLRPKADWQVLDFVRDHPFCPNDFLMMERGVWRLHPRLARRAARRRMRSDLLEELGEYGSFLNRSDADLDAQAQLLELVKQLLSINQVDQGRSIPSRFELRIACERSRRDE